MSVLKVIDDCLDDCPRSGAVSFIFTSFILQVGFENSVGCEGPKQQPKNLLNRNCNFVLDEADLGDNLRFSLRLHQTDFCW